jgi:hypothetical protein
MLLQNKILKNNRLKWANAIFFALAFFVTNSIASQCNPGELPFKSGERLDFDAYYNLKKLWVPAGKVRFEVSDSTINGEKCFLFEGKGKSLKAYDNFFKVRDHYSSVVNRETLRPYKFERDIHEGGFDLYYYYNFDQITKKARVATSKSDTTIKKVFDFPECTFDVISAVYYARTLNFDNMEEGDTIPIQLMMDQEVYSNVYVRYMGKARAKDQNGVYYKCIKFRPFLVEGTLFEEGEFMNVYVTDDRNRLPILVEAEILVGSVKAYLSSTKNVKYPLDSKIK